MPRASAKLRAGAIVAVRRRALFGEGRDDLPVTDRNDVCDLRVLTLSKRKVPNSRTTLCVVVSHPAAPGAVFYAAAGSARLLKLPDTPERDSSDKDEAEAAAADAIRLPAVDEQEDVLSEAEDDDEPPPVDAGDAERNPTPSPHLKAKTGSTYAFNRVVTALQIPTSVVRPPRHAPRWASEKEVDFVSPHAVFTSLFPPDLLKRMLAATSATLVAEGKRPVSKEELFAVIAGVMMTSGLYAGMTRADLFKPPTCEFYPRADLSTYISRQRVDDVLEALALSDTELPPYRDPLFRVGDAAVVQQAHAQRLHPRHRHLPG